MIIADRIYSEVSILPDELAREVLDFVGYLEMKHGLITQPDRDLLHAQERVLKKLWDNSQDDDVWNSL